VVASGAEAAAHGWAAGQRVAGTSHAGCGVCRACRTGRYNLCEAYGDETRGHRQYGHYSRGAYAEYVVQRITSVFRVPDSLSLEEAALLDPASIALHTVKRAEPAPGDTAAVIGPGPMGLLVLLCTLAVGTGRILVVGRGERLGLAAALGGDPVDYTQQDPVEAVRARTGGRGADVVYECAGAPAALRQAVLMAARGGRVAAIGIPVGPEGDGASLPLRRLVLDEIEVRGVRANRNTCEEVLPLLASGRVPAGRLITHRFPLRDFAAALETFVQRRDGAVKVLVKP
jgi:L-iditol 2-dehydrogenase